MTTSILTRIFIGMAAMLAVAGFTVGQAAAYCYIKEPLKPVRRTILHREVVEKGVYDVSRRPATSGWPIVHGVVQDDDEDNRIVLKPYRNYTHYQAPLIHYRRETIWVQPEGFRWRRVRSSPDCVDR